MGQGRIQFWKGAKSIFPITSTKTAHLAKMGANVVFCTPKKMVRKICTRFCRFVFLLLHIVYCSCVTFTSTDWIHRQLCSKLSVVRHFKVYLQNSILIKYSSFSLQMSGDRDIGSQKKLIEYLSHSSNFVTDVLKKLEKIENFVTGVSRTADATWSFKKVSDFRLERCN